MKSHGNITASDKYAVEPGPYVQSLILANDVFGDLPFDSTNLATRSDGNLGNGVHFQFQVKHKTIAGKL